MAPIALRSGKKPSPAEVAKIESVLVESLGSTIAMERRRMQKKVNALAKRDPKLVQRMLLRYYSTDDQLAKEGLRKLLAERVESNEGKELLVESLSDPDDGVRKGAGLLIPELWGLSAAPYPTLFEQTYQLVSKCRDKDVVVDDIETLMDMSKQSFLDDELMKAIYDIGSSLEFAKRRYKNSESMRIYMTEMLQMVPEFRMAGKTSVDFEESMLNAIRASKVRTYDYAQELIDRRVMEIEIKDKLREIGQVVHNLIMIRPAIEINQLSQKEIDLILKLQNCIETVNTRRLSGNPLGAVQGVHEFLFKDFTYYYDDVKFKLREGDRSIQLTIYMVGIVFVKMVSTIMPFVAEDIYQEFYRNLEGVSSIHMVLWPEVVLDLAKSLLAK